jgi:hypothetical protein
MLTVLGGLAEFERDLIRARTGEGRERAKARGVKMGRKPKLTPHQKAEAIKRRDAGEPMRDIGKSFNVSHSTISRLTAVRKINERSCWPGLARRPAAARAEYRLRRVGRACALIGLQPRQVFRLLRGLKQDGPTSLLFQAPGQAQQPSATR